jgi:Spy/CpxP family protein refolding chaperone
MKRIGLILVLACVGALAQQQPDPAQQAQASLRLQEANLRAKLENMLQTYSASYPDIKRLQEQLDGLHRKLAAFEGLAPGIAGGNWALYGPPANPPSMGGLQTGRPDKWWNNPSLAAFVGLTGDEQKKMDDVFQQYRLKLIDLNAALEKEEAILEPLVAATQLDESKIAAQIDRVAQARAELEKANGRMLLGIRKMLTQEQWNKLQRGTQ